MGNCASCRKGQPDLSKGPLTARKEEELAPGTVVVGDFKVGDEVYVKPTAGQTGRKVKVTGEKDAQGTRLITVLDETCDPPKTLHLWDTDLSHFQLG